MESSANLANGPEIGSETVEGAVRRLPNLRRIFQGWELDEPGYARLYFFAGAGLIKIGVSTRVDNRFRALCNSSPVKLEYLGDCLGTRADERDWHQRFKHLRRHGEWFEETAELLAAIEAAVDQFWRSNQ